MVPGNRITLKAFNSYMEKAFHLIAEGYTKESEDKQLRVKLSSTEFHVDWDTTSGTGGTPYKNNPKKRFNTQIFKNSKDAVKFFNSL